MKKCLICALILSGFLIQPVYAQGDVAKGKKVYRKCSACHSIQEGQHRIGPSMFGVYGRLAGSVEGFKYSKALKESGIVWNDEHLTGYLKKPKKYIPGNKMSFAGLRKEKDLLNIIAYLKTLK